MGVRSFVSIKNLTAYKSSWKKCFLYHSFIDLLTFRICFSYYFVFSAAFYNCRTVVLLFARFLSQSRKFDPQDLIPFKKRKIIYTFGQFPFRGTKPLGVSYR